LNVIVLFGFAVHLAQYVVFAVGTVVFVATRVPPLAADVFHHPLKVNPARVGFDGSVPIEEPAGLVSDADGDPPLALNVSDILFGVHLAQ